MCILQLFILFYICTSSWLIWNQLHCSHLKELDVSLQQKNLLQALARLWTDKFEQPCIILWQSKKGAREVVTEPGLNAKLVKYTAEVFCCAILATVFSQNEWENFIYFSMFLLVSPLHYTNKFTGVSSAGFLPPYPPFFFKSMKRKCIPLSGSAKSQYTAYIQ